MHELMLFVYLLQAPTRLRTWLVKVHPLIIRLQNIAVFNCFILAFCKKNIIHNFYRAA